MTKQAGHRIIWTDVIRIISVFCVAVGHASGTGFGGCFGARSWEWQICNFYDSVIRFCVPAFVMVSGVFLLDPEREYSLRKLYGVKIVRIVTAYLFWATFYSFAMLGVSWLRGEAIFDRHGVYRLLEGIVKGHIHLWFLPMIAGLYIITPFLRRIVRDEKLTVYFLVLSFVLVFCRNTLAMIPPVGKVLALTTDRLDVTLVAGYSGYFLWGYWLSKHRLPAAARKVIYLLGVLGALGTAAINGYLGYHFDKAVAWIFHNLALNIMLPASAAFVFCQYHFDSAMQDRLSPKWTETIVNLSRWSFGIFLIHAFFLGIMFQFGMRLFVACPLLFVPLSSAAAFLISIAAIALLEKIPVLNKYIM